MSQILHYTKFIYRLFEITKSEFNWNTYFFSADVCIKPRESLPFPEGKMWDKRAFLFGHHPQKHVQQSQLLWFALC